MVFSSKKRFIAGASCHQCKKIDVITVFHENGADWQACVACGHKETFIHQEDRGNKQGNRIPLQNTDEPLK